MKGNTIIWDIETSHSVVASFGLFNQNHSYKDILQEWYIISIAYKRHGDKKVHSLHIDKPGEDKKIIKEMHKVLSKADLLVHHNGDKFDIKKFNARAIFHGIPPLPEILQDDTLKMARKRFKFMSNRLDYIGDYLGVGHKVPTEPGLWIKVLHGDKSAIKRMVKYNKGDVTLLEAVYDKLLPWCGSKLNKNLLLKTDLHCPTCGGLEFRRDGNTYTKTTIRERYRCKGCGYVYTKPKNAVAR